MTPPSDWDWFNDPVPSFEQFEALLADLEFRSLCEKYAITAAPVDSPFTIKLPTNSNPEIAGISTIVETPEALDVGSRSQHSASDRLKSKSAMTELWRPLLLPTPLGPNVAAGEQTPKRKRVRRTTLASQLRQIWRAARAEGVNIAIAIDGGKITATKARETVEEPNEARALFKARVVPKEKVVL